ncbi:MAG TPA: LamG domain-containing protein [Chitinophagaceae bacterium]|nr:LamG domain-containing protein [Chitinophagaceae bacterium]MCB9055153.1 LamG domain-containing protein [Chitinophagales bacterium]HPG12370.1 LamG domain-containing protein [Chitinophagaceae bacterium]
MKKIKIILILVVAGMAGFSCQKLSRPGLGDYPKDANPPGGPLKFYVAFDGTSTNPLMNAVDSIRATFPNDNPLQPTAGINGNAIQGENQKFIKYSKPNDWATLSQDFSISFWEKHDGQTKNNAGTNGPEYAVSFKSTNGHWSGSSLLVFLEGNNTACAVKTMLVDKNNADGWMTWEGGSSMPGLMDNNWHHIVVTYNAASSTMTLYVDGVANPNLRTWGTHGGLNMSNSNISEVRIGNGPGTNYTSDDWLSSSWKGALDQFRMYSTTLSASEVQALYAARL